MTPSLPTAAVRGRAMAAAVRPGGLDWRTRLADLTRLGELRAAPVPADLAAWAIELADAGEPVGPSVPMLGTKLAAAPYPGLLWTGARAARAGLGISERLVLVALVSGGPRLDSAALSRAVAAGLATVAGLAAAADDPGAEDRGAERAGVDPPVAELSAEGVAAAVTAGLAVGLDATGLDAVIDLAGSLLLVAAPGPPDPLVAGIRAGHAMAVGWLASVLLGAGIRAPADALAATLETIGRPVFDVPAEGGRDRRSASHPVDGAAPDDPDDPGGLGSAELWALLR